ncbi:YfgM family protein [Thiovibrio sp. JS02]
MSDQDTYFQQEILNKPLQKHGLLEELNLPPKAIKFIRENRRNLFIALCCLVVSILAWSSYTRYTANRNDRGAAMLAEAMAQNLPEKRQELLKQVLAEYGRTGSAKWATVELGHLAFESGNYEEAIRNYQEVLRDISAKSPLFPLVQLNLAQAYENKKMLTEALAAYQKLAEKKGFAGEAYLAMARIHEEQGALPQAKEMYQKVLALAETPAASKDLVQAKLDRL